MLAGAAERRALARVEAEQELARWAADFDEERRTALGAAREEAERLVRAANLTARERARSRLEEVEDEAQRVLADARSEANRLLAGISAGASTSPAPLDTLGAAPNTIRPGSLTPCEPAPPTQSTATPSPAPTTASRSVAAAADATTGPIDGGCVDGHPQGDEVGDHPHVDEVVRGRQVGTAPGRGDLEWLLVDGARPTPRQTARTEILPAPVSDRPQPEWGTLIELVLSVLGVLAAALLLLWLWSP